MVQNPSSVVEDGVVETKQSEDALTQEGNNPSSSTDEFLSENPEDNDVNNNSTGTLSLHNSNNVSYSSGLTASDGGGGSLRSLGTSQTRETVVERKQRIAERRQQESSSSGSSKLVSHSRETVVERKQRIAERRQQESSSSGNSTLVSQSRESVVERKQRISERRQQESSSSGNSNSNSNLLSNLGDNNVSAMTIEETTTGAANDLQDFLVGESNATTTTTTTTVQGSMSIQPPLSQPSIYSHDDSNMDDEVPEVRAYTVDDPDIVQAKPVNLKRRWIVGVVVVVLLAIVVSGTCSTGVCSATSSTETSSRETLSPTAAPTYTPCFDYAQINERRTSIQQLLSRQTLTPYKLQHKTGTKTPEWRAFEWILDEDPLCLSDDDDRITQRYALACVWYATAGSGWNYEPVLADNAVVDEHDDSSSTPWLTTREECSWQGVVCGKNNTRVVTELRLEGMGLTGTLSPNIGLLTHLQVIRMRDNNLGGTYPSSYLSGMTSLGYLDLSANTMTGSLPDSLGNLTALTTLKLDEAEGAETVLTGSLPPTMSALTNLHHLQADYSNISIPDSLTTLQTLGGLKTFQWRFRRDLDVAPNFWNETLPKLTNLEVLAMTESYLSGSFPVEASTSLYIMDLKFNLLRGNPFPLLETLPKLIRWDALRGNQLTGTLPDNLCDFNHSLVNILADKENSFNGTIPSSIGCLTGLKRINFDFNNFSGTLPTTLGLLTNMIHIKLRYNALLSGTIPTELGKLSNLLSARLSGTGLSGQIPSELSSWSNLRSIDLENTFLSGTLPVELLQWSSVCDFSLQETNITGDFPFCLPDGSFSPEIRGCRGSEEIKMDVTLDCDRVMCPCCAGCNG